MSGFNQACPVVRRDGNSPVRCTSTLSLIYLGVKSCHNWVIIIGILKMFVLEIMLVVLANPEVLFSLEFTSFTKRNYFKYSIMISRTSSLLIPKLSQSFNQLITTLIEQGDLYLKIKIVNWMSSQTSNFHSRKLSNKEWVQTLELIPR